jgi:hypothetical protein
MKPNEDAMLARLSEPLHEVVQLLHDKGLDREHINQVINAMLPLVNHALRLDARMSALERQIRTDAQIREPRE